MYWHVFQNVFILILELFSRKIMISFAGNLHSFIHSNTETVTSKIVFHLKATLIYFQATFIQKQMYFWTLPKFQEELNCIEKKTQMDCSYYWDVSWNHFSRIWIYANETVWKATNRNKKTKYSQRCWLLLQP